MDLSQILELPTTLSTRPLTVVTSDDLNTSSFCLHNIILHKVRSIRSQQTKSGLTLVLLNQSYQHYSSVAAKSFGLNLKSLKDSGRLAVLDVLKDFSKYTKADGSFDLDLLEREIIESLCKFDSEEPSLLIIDDLSVLWSCLSLSPAAVLRFVTKLRSISVVTTPCIIIQSFIDRSDEDNEEGDESLGENGVLDCVIASSDAWIRFERLTTGFSDKVDGQLLLYDYSLTDPLAASLPITYHYKTIERNTKIFLPGNAFSL